MSEQARTMSIYALILFLITVGLGIWLGISGKPYNTALFTVHKLTGLGCVVLAVIVTVGRIRGAGAPGMQLFFIIAGILAVIALLATGGIMSGRPVTGFLRTIHIAATAVIVISGGGLLSFFA